MSAAATSFAGRQFKHISLEQPECVSTQACLVEDADDANEECVTFLYKLTQGACPKSYGFYAATLAGIPSSVTSMARAKAARLETSNANLAKFRLTAFVDIFNKF